MTENTMRINWLRVGLAAATLVIIIGVAVFFIFIKPQADSSQEQDAQNSSNSSENGDSANSANNDSSASESPDADDAGDNSSAGDDSSADDDSAGNNAGAGSDDKSNITTIMAMGDMLPHDTVNANALNADAGDAENSDYGQFFDGIRSHLKGADAIFCNQEVPSAGENFGISGYPVFNAPNKFAIDLNESAGCDLINLANNHAADFGIEGIAATRAVWDDLDTVSVSGTNRSAEEQNEIVYGEVNDITTALVSFAEYSNIAIDGVSLNLMGDTDLVHRLLTEARERADLVIVSAHWGTEDSHTVNDFQRGYAQLFADYGVDVIIGTGPHVLQPVEWIDRSDGGQTLVWYSIGNMLSSQLTLEQRTGIIASFEVELTTADDAHPVTITKPGGLLTYMHYDWSEEQEAAGDLLARNNLSITPLAESDELLERTRFGVSASDWAAAQGEILGPEVTLSGG